MSSAPNPYGDGNSAALILDALEKWGDFDLKVEMLPTGIASVGNGKLSRWEHEQKQ